MRRSFQQAMEGEFRQVVEEATGRKVIAYMSSIHVDPDLAVELFVLEPLEETESGLSVDGDDPVVSVDGDGPAPSLDGNEPV
jgi:Na+-translocating membrane potential-generating system (MpsC)